MLFSLSDPGRNNSSITVEDEGDHLHHNLHKSRSPDIGIKSVEDLGVRGKADGEKIDDLNKEERLARKAKVHKWPIPFPDMAEAEKEE